LGNKKTSKFEELTSNVVPRVILLTVKMYCVFELTGTMCVGLWHIYRKEALTKKYL